MSGNGEDKSKPPEPPPLIYREDIVEEMRQGFMAIVVQFVDMGIYPDWVEDALKQVQKEVKKLREKDAH